jgi:hypothetical protein
MIVVPELAVAAAGSGITHAPGNDSVIVGPRLKGRSPGQPSAYGIAVSVLRLPRRARESTPPALPRAGAYRSPLRMPQCPKPARSAGTRSRRALRHQAPQRTAADRSSTGIPASRVTAGHHDACPFPGLHHLRHHRRRCVGRRLPARDRHREPVAAIGSVQAAL